MGLSDPLYLPVLAVVAVVLGLLPQGNARLGWITLVGLVFCVGLGSTLFILPLLALLAFAGGLMMSRAASDRSRGRAFVISLLALLTPLLFFKWGPGLVSALAERSSAEGASSVFGHLALPIGISFYTFLALGYLIDVFIGTIAPVRSPLKFAAMMSFFPQLTAGPIERTRRLLPQFDRLGEFDYSRVVRGLRSILVGLFLKVVIADRLALHVAAVYDAPLEHGAPKLIIATVYFAFQIYADFLGYSLIAIGSARLLGIELIANFDHPFLSQSVPEFWRRWHISLSSWFRDYVFTPLQMKLRKWRAAGFILALVVTFMLVGVWHGTSLNFAVFGAIHGAMVVASTMTLGRRNAFWKSLEVSERLLAVGRTLCTFVLVVSTFVLFRAAGLAQALDIYGEMLAFEAKAEVVLRPLPLLLISVLVGGSLLTRRGWTFDRLPTFLRWCLYYAMILVIGVLMFLQEIAALSAPPQFIYYNF